MRRLACHDPVCHEKLSPEISSLMDAITAAEVIEIAQSVTTETKGKDVPRCLPRSVALRLLPTVENGRIDDRDALLSERRGMVTTKSLEDQTVSPKKRARTNLRKLRPSPS